MDACTHTRTHARAHTHTHTYTHTYICTYVPVYSREEGDKDIHNRIQNQWLYLML